MLFRSIVGLLAFVVSIGVTQAAKLPPLAHLTSTDNFEYIFDPTKISAVWTALLPHKIGQPPVFPPQAGPPRTTVYGVLSQPIFVNDSEDAFLEKFKLTGKFLKFTTTNAGFPVYLKPTGISVILPSSYFGSQYGSDVKTLIYMGNSDPFLVQEDAATVEAMVDAARAQADNP